MNNRQMGDYGERVAEQYLRHIGFKILERNYRQRSGEIDIIAMDNDTVVFIEVKTRAGNMFGRPSEAVDIRKMARISHMAMTYIYRKRLEDKPCRFDVIEILINKGFSVKSINLIENAFDLTI